MKALKEQLKKLDQTSAALVAHLRENYLSEDQLATALGLCTQTLRRWRYARKGPSPTIIGFSAYYRLDAVKEWLAAHERTMPHERSRKRVTAVQTEKHIST
jgi:hypothetical protein